MIDIKHMNVTGGSTMIVDIVSKKGVKRYIDEKKVDIKDIKYSECEKKFK